MSILDKACAAPPEFVRTLFAHEKAPLALIPATAGYFVYVTLGSVSPKLHEHAFTGDPDKSVLQRLKEGCPVMIPKNTYQEFYFPAYFRYWNTYRVHTLGAGLWLLSGAYNLYNPPKLAKLANGKLGYERTLLHKLSGYTYLVSGFLKGITVPMVCYYSHSLSNVMRVPLAALGVWDVLSLGAAFYHVGVKRNIMEHRRWMIRNFCVGGGSIWVRVFGAVWAAFDLSFMKDPLFFGQMNSLVLLGGFYYGAMFGEWYIAKDPARKKLLEKLMMLLCAVVAVCGRRLYTKRAYEKRAAHTAALAKRKQKVVQAAPSTARSP
eukprot:TRINITY_DN46792_c0_g1_i1.p1 TRINITY_DN46792_c0_g1~~TRINITY_DN46792_c0_g1_i1.p1  ORF type:complete len:320 (+),score=102.97 TRINITY_DN46792_c0_g1_i1:72-1031(+)